MAETYYEVLGVARDARPETVRKVYRDLVKAHHPDVGGEQVRFRRIRTSYEHLRDHREEYDRCLDRFGPARGHRAFAAWSRFRDRHPGVSFEMWLATVTEGLSAGRSSTRPPEDERIDWDGAWSTTRGYNPADPSRHPPRREDRAGPPATGPPGESDERSRESPGRDVVRRQWFGDRRVVILAAVAVAALATVTRNPSPATLVPAGATIAVLLAVLAVARAPRLALAFGGTLARALLAGGLLAVVGYLLLFG